MNRQLIEAFQSEIESALDAENYELVQALRRIRDRAKELVAKKAAASAVYQDQDFTPIHDRHVRRTVNMLGMERIDVTALRERILSANGGVLPSKARIMEMILEFHPEVAGYLVGKSLTKGEYSLAMIIMDERRWTDDQDPPSLFTVFSNGSPSHYTTVNQ